MRRLLALFVLWAVPAVGGLAVQISIDPPGGLPAFPPTIRVIVSNHGPAELTIPQRAALRAIRADGTSFIPYVGHRGDFFVADLQPGLSIGPHEEADLTWWSSSFSPPWFEADPRLFAPGVYRFVLVLDNGLDSEKLAGLDDPLDQAGLVNPLVSNTATYTVSVPEGTDAAVWGRIRNLPEPALWAATLADEIWSAYPTSSYAMLAVPNSPDLEEQIGFLERAIARDPDGLRASWHRLAIASFENQRLLSSLTAGNLQEAGKASDRARSLLKQIARETPDPTLQKEASEMLDTVMTRDEILEKHKMFSGQSPDEVYPYVECTEHTEGQVNLWLGYGNTGASPVSMGVGARNQFTPPPKDRGQPTNFRPGVHHLAFKITVDQPQIIWHLDKTNVTVRVETVPRCPEGFLEVSQASGY